MKVNAKLRDVMREVHRESYPHPGIPPSKPTIRPFDSSDDPTGVHVLEIIRQYLG